MWRYILLYGSEAESIAEYISCIKSIPAPIEGVDIAGLKDIVDKIYRGDIRSVDEAVDMLRQVIEKAPDGYLGFLARALFTCRDYAKRYEKCWELEKQHADPDEIEKCLEIADKTKMPFFVW